jgi:hypothetical protein
VRADPRRRRRADAVAGYGGVFFDGDEPMAELAIMLIADARAHLLTGSVNVAWRCRVQSGMAALTPEVL